MKRTDLEALFWKEWHENLRWAVLVLLCLAGSLVYAVYYEVGRNQFSSNSGAIPIWGNVNLVMTIGAPLAGLAFGLLQILPELRRDQWAFLVHRPVPRPTLFLGKVLPGVCLYLLAVTPPLLGVAAWDAAPGHVAAPFDFRFTLGGWAAILTGIAFYFAGLLVALRPARWYGGRALPIVAALFGPFAANWYGEFWQFVPACAVVIGVLFAAAWGSFVTDGDYRQQSKPARFALGVTLYAGILVCVAALFALSIAAYDAVSPRPASAFISTQYEIDTSGRILRVTRDRVGNEIKTTDLLGHAVSVAATGDGGGAGYPFLRVTDFVAPWMQNPAGSRRYSDPSRYALPLQTYLYQRADTAWYYVYSANQAVGYSMQTRLRIGYLGPRGFSSSREDAGQFPELLSDTDHRNNTSALLQFPHAVYRLDSDRQTLAKLWSSDSAALDGVGYLDGNGMMIRLDAYAIAAGTSIHVFSAEGTRLFDLPRSFPPSVYPVIQAASNPQGSRYYFWYAAKDCILPSLGLLPSTLVTVASDGHVLQTTSLPALVPARVQTRTPAAVGLLMPPALLPADGGRIGILITLGDPGAKAEWQSLSRDKGFAGVLALSLLSGLPAAVLGWLISRRCGDGRRGQIAWVVGVFWLGIYGVLLLLALRAWPARVRCPSCERLRVVDRATCERCGAQFARPRRDGTEIFDTEEAAVG